MGKKTTKQKSTGFEKGDMLLSPTGIEMSEGMLKYFGNSAKQRLKGIIVLVLNPSRHKHHKERRMV